MDYISLYCLIFVCIGITSVCPQSLTKLQCQKGESRTFDYQSITKLWGPIGQTARISFDVNVDCMGKEHKLDGLRYKVKLSNINSDSLKEIKRTKRDLKTWLMGAWETIKEWLEKAFNRRLNKQVSSRKCQAKRNPYEIIMNKLKLPFEFVQSTDGKIEAIRFTKEDTEDDIKTLKRHVVDVFATQLDEIKNNTLETSPIGQHLSHYQYNPPKNVIENDFKLASSVFYDFIIRMFSRKSKDKEPPTQTDEEKKDQQDINIYRDIKKEDVLTLGSMVHDMNQFDIQAKQVQKISNGQLIKAAGYLSIKLAANENNTHSRKRRSLEDDSNMMNYLHVDITYTMKINKRNKRSVDDNKENNSTLNEEQIKFYDDTLISRFPKESIEKERLQSLLDTIKSSSLKAFKEALSTTKSSLFLILQEIIQIEAKLNLTQNSESITKLFVDAFKRTDLEKYCLKNNEIDLNKCNGILRLLYQAYSLDATDLLIKHWDNSEINSILASLHYPTEEIMNKLINEYMISDAEHKGMKLLTITSLANPKLNESHFRIYNILNDELDVIKCDHSTIDLLESVSNFAGELFKTKLTKIPYICKDNNMFMTATVHALGNTIFYETINKWLIEQLVDDVVNCFVKKEIIQTINKHINNLNTDKWSKYNFTNLDNTFIDMLDIKMLTGDNNNNNNNNNNINNNDILETNKCLQSDLVNYFSLRNINLHSLINNEKVKSEDNVRVRRAIFNQFWDISNCENVYPTRRKSTVIRDDSLDPEYPEGRSVQCTAKKNLGPSLARATITADINNDITSNGNNMTAAFTFDTSFLGKKMDVGKIYLYLQDNKTRLYLKIFDKTYLQSNANCQPQIIDNTLFVPLYDFGLWVVRVALGIRTNLEINVKQCNQYNSYELSSLARLRLAGEASGSVVLLRSGFNIGGDFNYNGDLKLINYPKMCISANHGYNPMNVSVQSWYQLWDNECNDWSERNIFKPLKANWKISKGRSNPWLLNECFE